MRTHTGTKHSVDLLGKLASQVLYQHVGDVGFTRASPEIDDDVFLLGFLQQLILTVYSQHQQSQHFYQPGKASLEGPPSSALPCCSFTLTRTIIPQMLDLSSAMAATRLPHSLHWATVKSEKYFIMLSLDKYRPALLTGRELFGLSSEVCGVWKNTVNTQHQQI